MIVLLWKVIMLMNEVEFCKKKNVFSLISPGT